MILPIVLCAVSVGCMILLFEQGMYWKRDATWARQWKATWYEQCQAFSRELVQLRQQHRELKEKHGRLILSLQELAPYQTQWEIDADRTHKERQRAAFKARVQDAHQEIGG